MIHHINSSILKQPSYEYFIVKHWKVRMMSIDFKYIITCHGYFFFFFTQVCLSLQPLTASYIKITHLWFRLAKRSVPLVLSPWRILLVAFLLTAMIEFKIILHLLGSSSTISHVSISSLFQDRQGCCDGNFQEFHYITESFSF